MNDNMSNPSGAQINDDMFKMPSGKSSLGSTNDPSIMPTSRAIPEISEVSNDAWTDMSVDALDDNSSDSQKGMGYGNAKTGLKNSPSKI